MPRQRNWKGTNSMLEKIPSWHMAKSANHAPPPKVINVISTDSPRIIYGIVENLTYLL
jgi:hypothetical protein